MSVTVPEELVGAFNGSLVMPERRGLRRRARVHNGLIDKRPGVIARCHNVADVRDAVVFGRDERPGDLGARREVTTSPVGR